MEASLNKSDNLIICSHPLVSDNLASIRNKNTSSEKFRLAVKKIAQLLFYKATENLPIASTTVESPLMETQVEVILPDVEIIIAPILRAGLAFSDVALELLPQARVHHIGLYRDEETLKPVPYYNNLPPSFKSEKNTFVYLLDPMLATGGSAIAAIKLFTEMGISQENITFVSLISAPEGVERIHAKYNRIKIVTASLDSCLNEVGYIMPGLGDAGDRTFNTNY